MPTWVTMTALLLWLTCPVVYTIAVGRHYAQRCQAELAAVQSCVDEISGLRESLADPPTVPFPAVPASGKHRLDH